MTVAEALSLGREVLGKAGLDPRTAEQETRLILAHILGIGPLDLFLYLERKIPGKEFERLLRERASGKPLAYVLGEVEFYGRRFEIVPGVLIPRPETEILVETVLQTPLPPGPLLELGVGSGVVIITCLQELEDRWALGIDVSTLALRLTRRNALRYGIKDRLHLCQGDWLSPLRPSPCWAAIISNPPYVSEREKEYLSWEILRYEPPEALFAGPDGLEYIRRTIEEAPDYLLPEGFLFLEIGYGQKDPVERLCQERGLEVNFRKDLAGIDRVAVIRR